MKLTIFNIYEMDNGMNYEILNIVQKIREFIRKKERALPWEFEDSKRLRKIHALKTLWQLKIWNTL